MHIIFSVYGSTKDDAVAISIILSLYSRLNILTKRQICWKQSENNGDHK